VPLRPSTATLVEYSHRLSSGLVVVLVAALVAWAFRAAPKGHPLRRGAVLSLAFTLSEAAVGAGLVLFKLVAHDESLTRAFAISTHLINTLLLLAALTLTAHAAGGFRAAAAGFSAAGDVAPALSASAGGGHRPEPRRWTGWAFTLGLAATIAIAATGAVAALGDTLFPAASLRQGLAQDLSPASHLLLRLRSVHPLLALALGAYLLYLCREAAAAAGAGQPARRWADRLRFLVLGQWMLGLLNVALLAPVWLQLTHLLVADLVWIALVLLTLETLAGKPVPAPLPPLVPAPARG
jgi:heme A synthase